LAILRFTYCSAHTQTTCASLPRATSWLRAWARGPQCWLATGADTRRRCKHGQQVQRLQSCDTWTSSTGVTFPLCITLHSSRRSTCDWSRCPCLKLFALGTRTGKAVQEEHKISSHVWDHYCWHRRSSVFIVGQIDRGKLQALKTIITELSCIKTMLKVQNGLEFVEIPRELAKEPWMLFGTANSNVCSLLC